MLKWHTIKRQVTPPSSGPAGTKRSYDATRGQRTNQAQYLEERLRNGISPAAVIGTTALLVQMEVQQTLSSITVVKVADLTGYKRTMTCRNGVFDRYDLTQQFRMLVQQQRMGQAVTRRLSRRLRCVCLRKRLYIQRLH